MTDRYSIFEGDAKLTLQLGFDEHSVDSIVTDPPYHLTTGKKGGSGPASVNLESPYGRARVTTGFMGMTWDGGDVAQDSTFWAECLRVLKPGGYLLAFSGTRTYHRMVCAIEDAGFEVRDQIGWVYGSGFPKSHNGEWGGTALKPAWEPICMARKPLVGTVEANWLAYGTGALNIDGCRISTDESLNGGTYSPGGKAGPMPGDTRVGASLGMFAPGARPQGDYVQPIGRWPANIIHDGSDDVVSVFPQAPGQIAKAAEGADRRKDQNVYGAMSRGSNGSEPRDDSGSAARFFYCAKASKADREAGLHAGDSGMRANTHPTVKPTELMRYLCRLVTPKGGLVLDPFMGSGSTGKAAMLEGFRFAGIDITPEYVRIARARIEATL